MSEVENSITRKIIKEQIKRIKNVTDEDYKPREDLDFIDVFFPKLCAIYGARLCFAIYEGKDISQMLSNRGLSGLHFNEIDNIMQTGIDNYKLNNGTLEILFEIEKAYDEKLKSYTEIVREKLEKDGKIIELDILNEATKDSFSLNSAIYTPCSEYEQKNIVK